jgi:hypothetical protein
MSLERNGLKWDIIVKMLLKYGVKMLDSLSQCKVGWRAFAAMIMSVM